jgi:hypothetical protein
MALTNTLLLDAILEARAIEGLGFQENERRRSKYGALESALDGVNRLVPRTTLEAIKQATSQTTKIDVFAKEAEGTLAARKCAGAGGATTASVNLVYQPFFEEFQISSIEHEGNRAKMTETLAHMIIERFRSLHSRVNAAGVAYLEANAVAGAGSFGTTVANAKQFAQATKADYFNQITTNMEENDFFGDYINVHSFSQSQLVRLDEANNDNNINNLTSTSLGFRHYSAKGVVNGAGVESTSYFFQDGTFGIIPWTNQLSRMGKTIGTDEWTMMADPYGLLGNIECKIKEECVDNSATLGAGAEADHVISYVMGLEVAYLSAYDSTGTDSGIYKGEVLV